MALRCLSLQPKIKNYWSAWHLPWTWKCIYTLDEILHKGCPKTMNSIECLCSRELRINFWPMVDWMSIQSFDKHKPLENPNKLCFTQANWLSFYWILLAKCRDGLRVVDAKKLWWVAVSTRSFEKFVFCKTCKKQFALVLWENIAVYPPKTLSTWPGIKLSPKTLIKSLFITFVDR